MGEIMTLKDLRTKAETALADVKDVWVHECADISFDTMVVSGTRLEVEFSASKVLGLYPLRDQEKQAEWCQRHRDLHRPAITAAKAALRKARIEFVEIDNGKGIKKLKLNIPKITKRKVK